MKPLLIIMSVALVAGIVLTASGLLYPNALDRYGMNRVLEARSTANDHAMLKLTEVWSNEIYLEASIPIAAHGDDRSFAWLESTTKAMALSEALVSSIKYIIGRPRPDGDLDRKNSSFPSSHASSAFAFATVLARHYPERGARAFEVAFCVSASRVYLERHYPSDVAAGAALGMAAAMASEIYLFWIRFDRDTFLDVLLFISGSPPPAEIETPLFRAPDPGD